ncbi:hypothetical protein DT23_03520 [Thioclava indica]|uniref:Uncharacterized protein n=1 Tax=Thioclava indica TaxID=1353528 RepID=A0A074KG96_9RHOB|nr:hypothetical protein DT23_03520 [Thioclava indica]
MFERGTRAGLESRVFWRHKHVQDKAEGGHTKVGNKPLHARGE